MSPLSLSLIHSLIHSLAFSLALSPVPSLLFPLFLPPSRPPPLFFSPSLACSLILAAVSSPLSPSLSLSL